MQADSDPIAELRVKCPPIISTFRRTIFRFSDDVALRACS